MFNNAAFSPPAVHCNLSQNGIDHQMCPEDMTSQLEEEEEFVDGGAVLLDEDGPSFRGVSPPPYQRRSAPQRSVSESELTRVRTPHTQSRVTRPTGGVEGCSCC